MQRAFKDHEPISEGREFVPSSVLPGYPLGEAKRRLIANGTYREDGTVALEGPEAGTYFRGRGRFQRGLATIEVSEDFRMVTDPEGVVP